MEDKAHQEILAHLETLELKVILVTQVFLGKMAQMEKLVM